MKLFLVMSGEYDEYGVAAVCTTQAKADALVAAGIGHTIEEFHTDPVIEPMPGGMKAFTVTVSRDGTDISFHEEQPYQLSDSGKSFVAKWPEKIEQWGDEYRPPFRSFKLRAKTEAEARQEVQEYRTYLLITGQWPYIEPPKPVKGLTINVDRGQILNDGTDAFLKKASELGADLTDRILQTSTKPV